MPLKLPALLALAVLTVSGCGAPLQSQYQRAIRDAATRRSEWSLPLWSFGNADPVSVSTFTDDPALDTVTQHNWVAATAEIAARCRGKSGTVLFLEETLGLPPQLEPAPGKRWHVYTFEVSPREMFRPCPGGVDESVSNRPRCIAGTDLDAQLDPDTARFLLHQFWYSHRTAVGSGASLEYGYPWTGMGWTYDWNPRSKDHVGVSEFVVRPGALPRNVRDDSPAQFCHVDGPRGAP